MPDAHKNFAYSLVATAPSPATSGTSLVVTATQGALFPAAPFNAVIWPTASMPTAANAEVVRVTAKSTDTLTIVRAQEGSTARTVIVGDQIAVAPTAKTFTDIENILPFFNVKDSKYGAVGDGSTDDSTAIQAAINACQSAGGGIVFFPAASYRLTAAGLSVTASGVTLLGASAGSTFITVAQNASITPISLTGNSGSIYSIGYMAVRGLTISMATGASSGTTPGISISYCLFPTIEDVTIQGFQKNLNLIGTTDVRAHRMFIDMSGVSTSTMYGVYSDGSSVQNASLYLHECNVIGPASGTRYGYYSTGAHIADLFIDSCEAEGQTYGLYIDGTSATSAFQTTDMHIRQFVADQVINGILITAVNAASAGGQIDIDNFDYACSGSTGTGITVTNSSGVHIRGAQLIGFTAATGISITGSTDCTVENADFTATITTGISLSGSSWCSIADNTFRSTSSGATAISIVSSSTGVAVKGNIIRGVGVTITNGISIGSGCSNVTATGNIIDGSTVTNPLNITAGLSGIIANSNPIQANVVTSPTVTSGSAFTASATCDAMVYIQTAGVTGTVTVTMGPSTGSENTLVNAQATLLGAGDLLTFRVPCGWKMVVTLVTVTITQTRVVTC